ncbi:ATP synthase regulation protein NCA2-domain-containing protein [Lipomyces oligophaga]|uniref:ATP synthase regulation protein NCA2-domain-containing protein n=1 Tax=Lipomyces oligophaga TaxID=45792 RepID=UPI0034CEBB9E
MSTIVDDRVRALYGQLELLASVTLPSVLAPKIGVRGPGGLDSGLSTPADEKSSTLASTEAMLMILNKLMVRPGEPRPTLASLSSLLNQYLLVAPDLQLASSRKQLAESNDSENVKAYLSNDDADDIWEDYEESDADGEKQVEWFVIASATIVLYGHMLEALLSQTLPLAEDIYYWDSVLTGPGGLLVHSIQVAPLTLLSATKEIYNDARARVETVRPSLSQWISTLRDSFARRRRQVRRMSSWSKIKPPGLSLLQLTVSPLSTVYKDIQKKQQRLRKLRELQSASLGILVGESISLNMHSDWRRNVEHTIDKLEVILQGVVDNSDESTVERFESKVLGSSDMPKSRRPPYLLAERMTRIANTLIPQQAIAQKLEIQASGKPPFLIRYWPVIIFGFTFGGTMLQILVKRRASIAEWCQDAATTAADFWKNWILEPVKSIISTIRHDDDAQIAIVGKKSLEADMDSLERMVVDFAIDTNKRAAGGALSNVDVEIIRDNVREGDLSAVLRVYEQELKSPFRNALQGELIRTLLIQVQKTKVDVEVAISGIDRLLKSQELVFGVVAALPSSVITWFTCKFIYNTYNGKGIRSKSELRASVVRTLGNIERMLTVYSLGKSGQAWLSYSELGAILCEVHVLRNSVEILPRQLRGDWFRDLGDLENMKLGVLGQRSTVDRIWHVYGKYLL